MKQRTENQQARSRSGQVTVTRRLPDGTRTTTVQDDPAVISARAALDRRDQARGRRIDWTDQEAKAQRQMDISRARTLEGLDFAAVRPGPTTSRRNTRSAERRSHDPMGSTARTRRVSAVLGRKPSRWTWREYHAIAQKTPWSLPFASPRLSAPGRRLTATEAATVRRAHDALAAGKIAATEYRTMIGRVTR